MTRRSTRDVMLAAASGGYAVPAVNIVDDLSLRALCRAAEDAASPVIVQTSVKTVRSLSAEYLATAFARAVRDVSVPVALHLDHCPDRQVITECLNCGWDSVLFDASDRPYDAALSETREVVAEARAAGASVESEIENIAGVEDDIGADEQGGLYTVSQVAGFVTASGCDFFAPAVGTAHGMYAKSPQLDPERARQIAQATAVPLVLHGGTGLTVEQFHDFIQAGCHKVNLSTTLKHAYMRSALEHLQIAERTQTWDPPALFAHISDAVSDDARRYFTWFGSEGRAD
jgi:ketose-bisphosphate aldolase